MAIVLLLLRLLLLSPGEGAIGLEVAAALLDDNGPSSRVTMDYNISKPSVEQFQSQSTHFKLFEALALILPWALNVTIVSQSRDSLCHCLLIAMAQLASDANSHAMLTCYTHRLYD